MATGNLIRAWGGPSQRYEWPQNEHGISIDARGFVWIGGNGEKDGQYLKFTRTGEFVLQIGKSGPQTNSNDTARLGRPADAEVDPETNEVYIADGYFNHRVIVFDANTGTYKRHWGAYGKKPSDEKLPPYNPAAAASPQFGNPVHCVKIAKDGLVYICDRSNDRIQIFRKDGTFVSEFIIEKNTLGPGSVWDLDFWIDPSRRSCSMPMAPIMRCERCGGKLARSSARSAEMAATLASSTGCTIWRWIRKATSTRPRWTRVSGHKNSAMSARQCGKSSTADSFPQRDTITHEAHWTIQVVAALDIINPVAVANIETVLGAIPPDRVLDKPGKGLRKVGVELPGVDPLGHGLIMSAQPPGR